ncbi:heparan-alpha-glucosaminide N-acetyltransferase [Desulfoscipio sp. XC116]|uniref:heparan-alpha-glucosaminide N-acetyltransferase n=1 Tax=Desulfoscipio sp. XC116 TaxID=3144975 RepID=UPI00325AF8FF
MEQPINRRLREIDILRGIALALMIVYHLLYDLNVFFNFSIAYDKGLFYLTGKSAAVLFILVAGISSSFSRNNIYRGLKLITWGCVIFLITYIVVPGSNIVFGILQFLGVCLLLYPMFKNISSSVLAAAGTAIILIDEFIAQLSVSQNWLVPLGFREPSFSSVDYFPLIPWLGVFLWGLSISKIIYKQKNSLIKAENKLFKPFSAIGKHTLVIYLVHQPIIMAALYLIIDPIDFFNMFENIWATS